MYAIEERVIYSSFSLNSYHYFVILFLSIAPTTHFYLPNRFDMTLCKFKVYSVLFWYIYVLLCACQCSNIYHIT